MLALLSMSILPMLSVFRQCPTVSDSNLTVLRQSDSPTSCPTCCPTASDSCPTGQRPTVQQPEFPSYLHIFAHMRTSSHIFAHIRTIFAPYPSQYGVTPAGSRAKASLTLAHLLQPLRDRGPVRTNVYMYTVQRPSLLPVEKRELVADKLHTGHAVELKRTQSKPRGSCRRSRGRKRGVALRLHLTRNASSTAP